MATKHFNKYHYLNLLAEIRDYLRELHNPNPRDWDASIQHPIPQRIVDGFNAIAKKLGSSESDWMIGGSGGHTS